MFLGGVTSRATAEQGDKPVNEIMNRNMLMTAFEETLVVYHEPHFVRWAVRALTSDTPKEERKSAPHWREAVNRALMTDSWAALAAADCLLGWATGDNRYFVEATQEALRGQDLSMRYPISYLGEWIDDDKVDDDK